jgi:Rod binding domain-containing protein
MSSPAIQSVPTDPQSMAAVKKHKQLVSQTQKWVGDAFYGTLLKQMRESPFKSDIFDGGHGGEMFTTLFDQQLADRMSGAAPDKLVQSIVKKIEGHKASAAYLKQSSQSSEAGDLAQKARSYVTPTR